MQLNSDLVLILGISIAYCIATQVQYVKSHDFRKGKSARKYSEKGTTNSLKDNSKQGNQLIIYDPHTGKEMEPMQYLPIVLGNKRKPAKPNDNLVELPQLWNPCMCFDVRCTCCLGIRLGLNFDQRVCVIIEYNSAQIAIQLRITYNRRTIATFGFSARNPPAYCVPILMPLPVFACLRLYDIRTLGGNVQICVSLMLKVLMNTIFEFHFDCIRFGVNGVIFVQRGQMTLETSLEAVDDDDDDEIILKGDGERRQSIQLEENYSGISVEPAEEYVGNVGEIGVEEDATVPIIRKGNRG